MVAFVHHPAGDMGIRGKDEDEGEFIPVVYEFNLSADVDKTICTLSRAMRVRAISGRPDVLNGVALTATVRKVPSGTAVSAGTALHSGTFDANSGVNTVQNLTLSTTNGVLDLAIGDSIGVDLSAANTAAEGSITVWMTPR